MKAQNVFIYEVCLFIFTRVRDKLIISLLSGDSVKEKQTWKFDKGRGKEEIMDDAFLSCFDSGGLPFEGGRN